MSTQITTIHDNLITKLASLFSTGLRLPNPYNLQDNPQGKLQLGYGVKMGPGKNGDRHINCRVDLDRDISIVLSRDYVSTDADYTTKASTEKSLLEDAVILLRNIEGDSTLSAACIDFKYQSDSGIQFVFDERQFLYIEMVFLCKYQETPT